MKNRDKVIYEIYQCFFQTVKTEGPCALYKGFCPTWVRLGPWNIIVSFPIIKKILKKLCTNRCENHNFFYLLLKYILILIIYYALVMMDLDHCVVFHDVWAAEEGVLNNCDIHLHTPTLQADLCPRPQPKEILWLLLKHADPLACHDVRMQILNLVSMQIFVTAVPDPRTDGPQISWTYPFQKVSNSSHKFLKILFSDIICWCMKDALLLNSSDFA